MEATGVYWKPVWHILEDDFELMLVNARHVKQVPGRKTDMSDAAWLCQLAEAGLLKANFVPPKPIRDLRQLTRYRKTQIAERQREAQRLHKALEDTNVKLDCVASDLLGASGRAMLDALVAGTTDPEVLAELAKGRLRQKLPALREALEGRFNDLHALLIGAILAHLDFLDEQIERLSEAIEERIAPFERAVELLCTIPGVQRRTAEVLIAEIGPDMTVFPQRTAPGLLGRAVSRQRPLRRQATLRPPTQGITLAQRRAQRRRDGRDPDQNSYLRALYERQRSRIGHAKAIGAVKHSIVVAIWHMLTNGELYIDLGPDYFRRRDPARSTKRLIAQLESLGHTVTLQDTAA